MPDSKFLQEYPLYKKFQMGVPMMLRDIPKASAHMYCHSCKSEQTFNMVNNYYDTFSYNDLSQGKVLKAVYGCTSCKSFFQHFLLKIDSKLKYIMKVGQDPPWSIDMDKNLAKLLGEHQEVFKNGLVCESQGYGIGAFSYYRRITELIIGELLGYIPDLMSGEEKGKYEEALKKASETKIAQDKIALVKDLLPPILRPNGMNPLATLHDTLSEGLHEKNDEECMELAENIRGVLIFLVNQVIRSREASKGFTESMKKILAKNQNKV